jgi:hypothetical protein
MFQCALPPSYQGSKKRSPDGVEMSFFPLFLHHLERPITRMDMMRRVDLSGRGITFFGDSIAPHTCPILLVSRLDRMEMETYHFTLAHDYLLKNPSLRSLSALLVMFKQFYAKGTGGQYPELG